MKKISILLISTLICSVILFGCTPSGNAGGGGYVNEDGDIIDVGANDGLVTEDGGIVNGSDNSAEEEKPTDENPTDENPTDENPTDENPTDENPTDENPNEPALQVGTNVGDLFADLTLTTMDGGSVNTADFRGKIVILNAWAERCPPCKAELPDFNRIAAEYKDRVVIIAADVDAGYGNSKAYVDTNFPETEIIFAYDTIYGDAYEAIGGVQYIPHTAIIDQNGVIVYTDSGMLTYSWLVNMIEQLLK